MYESVICLRNKAIYLMKMCIWQNLKNSKITTAWSQKALFLESQREGSLAASSFSFYAAKCHNL